MRSQPRQDPLRLRVPNFIANWDSFSPQTLTVKLDGMPIDWLSPYIPELRFRGGRGAISEQAYPDMDEFFHDVAKAALNEAQFENRLLKRYIEEQPEADSAP